MSWISENKIPAAIIGVSAVGAIGLGVMLFSAYSSYDENLQNFGNLNRSLAALKSGSLAPTPENLEKKSALVTDYTTKANQLALVLNRLQKPDAPITDTADTEFQSKLKAKIAAARQLAAERRAQLPAEFNLAFDKYTTELPKSKAVAAQLSTYLDAVDELVKLLLNSGILRMETLERSELDSEKDAPSAKEAAAAKAQPKAPQRPQRAVPGRPGAPAVALAPAKVTERWQVKTVIALDQAALQVIMSKLASPSETPDIPYFPIVRLVRIENERKDGPTTAQAAVPALAPAGGAAAPAAPGGTGVAAAAADVIEPVKPAAPDSVVILGKEKLRAYLEIDLVKFLEAQAAAAPTR
ncbi:MAG: Amuc_1100 family pilus-like protein [Prosthecobacter sp.]|nr:Amuc_1100 family pilus-like protein [Prosthecobacter sp.]